MTQVVNHKGKRLKVGPRGGLPYIYINTYIYIYGSDVGVIRGMVDV